MRERGLLSLEQAIREMTLIPRQILEGFVPHVKMKGRIRVGMNADIVVFGPAIVADTATYENANQTAVGVQAVLENGGFVFATVSLSWMPTVASRHGAH